MDELDEIIEDLESTISMIWRTEIKKDYLNRIFIYSEHELVAAFYYHLRKRIENMRYKNIRVFLEFPYEKNPRKRFDLVVMVQKENLPWEEHPFMSYQEGQVLFAMEFKFIQYIRNWHDIRKEMKKLVDLREIHKSIRRLYFFSIGSINVNSFKMITERVVSKYAYLVRIGIGNPLNLKGDIEEHSSKEEDWDFSIKYLNRRKQIRSKRVKQ